MSLPVADAWYEIETLQDGVSLIGETHVRPFLRANMWHVRGRDRDLLVDSGMGLRPLKDIALLARRPVALVATHAHFDHIGGAHEFGERLGHRAEAAIHADPTLERTCATGWVETHFLSALPEAGYDPATYGLRPAPLTGFLDEGGVVDLGDRSFRVLHLPGHSPGSIGLYEERTGILLSGDAIYDGELIDDYYHSDAEAYRATLRRLRDLPVSIVHAGHDRSFDAETMRKVIDAYLAGGQRMTSIDDYLKPYRRAAP